MFKVTCFPLILEKVLKLHQMITVWFRNL